MFFQKCQYYHWHFCYTVIFEKYNSNFSEADDKPVWFHDLYCTDDLFLMRYIRNVNSDEIIGTLVIEVSKDLLLNNLKISDFNNLEQSSLLDLSGLVIMTDTNGSI